MGHRIDFDDRKPFEKGIKKSAFDKSIFKFCFFFKRNN